MNREILEDLIEEYANAHEDAVSEMNTSLSWARFIEAGNNLACYLDKMELDNNTLRAHIAELESERRWKDSNVELPTEDTDGNTLLVIHRHSGEWARAPFGVEYSDEFVRHYSHWMYAPELPEVEQ